MVSIIIPVYNVEKYIDRCMRSVVDQTYKELEIILVDDGSTDDSGRKCEKWVMHDPRIKVYHKSNGGLMSAWKYGVEKSSGDYIGFVDSDDWIDSDMYETLLRHIEAQQADLALCGIVKDFEDGKASEKETILLNKAVYSRAEIVKEIYPMAICCGQTGSRGISPNRVTKLFKRWLIVDVMRDCPDDVSIGEDLVTTVSAITRCSRLCVIHDFHPYHYRINSESMIQKYSDAKYGKIKSLNSALKAVNIQNGMVFTDQIANDYIKVLFETIEQEILLSHYPYSKLKADIKRETASEFFSDNLQKLDRRKLGYKEKLYLHLIRSHFYGVLILIRKIYRRA